MTKEYQETNSKKKTQQIRKKHGTHKATARRKDEKTRDSPQIKARFQKDRHEFVKKNEYFWAKIRYRDEEKLVKKQEKKNEIKNKREKRKMSAIKKKRRKNGHEEKR